MEKHILEKGYSYTYMSSLHRAMVNILNFACDCDYLKVNVAKKVKNFPRRDYMPKVNFWTIEEYNQFISKVDDIVYHTLFELLYCTGIRKGEALALNWNDFKEPYLDINKTLIRSSVQNSIINKPKTQSSIRVIKLDDKVIDSLKKLKHYYKDFIKFNDNWFIFGGVQPLGTTTLDRKKKLLL